MRLLNCDRNPSNILVQSKDDMRSLIPIDHGYCMPSKLQIFEWDWAWYHYPHIAHPVCPEIVSYMQSIDLGRLIHQVSQHVVLTEDCIFLLKLTHYLLLHGMEAGLSLKNLSRIISRSGMSEDFPSPLEKIITEAEENAYRTIESTQRRIYEKECLGMRNTPANEFSSTSPINEYSPLRKRSKSSLSCGNILALTEHYSVSKDILITSLSSTNLREGKFRSLLEDNSICISINHLDHEASVVSNRQEDECVDSSFANFLSPSFSFVGGGHSNGLNFLSSSSPTR